MAITTKTQTQYAELVKGLLDFDIDGIRDLYRCCKEKLDEAVAGSDEQKVYDYQFCLDALIEAGKHVAAKSEAPSIPTPPTVDVAATTVAEPVSSADVEASLKPAAPSATPRQLEFIVKEGARRQLIDTVRTIVERATAGEPVTKVEASTALDYLFNAPFADRKPADAELEDAMYRTPDGKIWKVYHTVHGANMQVAKELIILDEPYETVKRGKTVEVKAEFEYRGKAPLANILPEHRMSLEDAEKYGAIYGVCIRCAATLTKEKSIARAMGDVCASKF